MGGLKDTIVEALMTLRGGISMAQKMGLLMSVLFVDFMAEGVCRVPSMLNERTQGDVESSRRQSKAVYAWLLSWFPN